MMTKEQLIAFEDKVKDLWEAGELPYLIHLSGGNEELLIEIFNSVRKGDWIFSNHRNHYHALLAGVPEAKLMRLIQDGKSMFVFDKEHRFLTSSILAGTCCIAAGVAHAIKSEGGSERVWCFLGDGAEEQGHFYEAAHFVEANDLPCTFIIEDNDRSVDTTKAGRGRGKMLDSLYDCVIRYNYKATYPHAGSGCAHRIAFKPVVR